MQQVGGMGGMGGGGQQQQAQQYTKPVHNEVYKITNLG